ncbi:MAG TPA: hypothetical protein PKG81_00360 [Candidatus Omnitrophota bacterium]|nr:hypothetical protein [Candidatus Omnitrophota bacterium]
MINIGVLGNPSLIFKIVSSCKDIKDMQNSAEKTEIFPVFKNGVTTLENIPKSFKDTQEFEIAQKMLLPIEEFAASEPLSTKEILIDRIESQLGRILTAYEDLEYDYLKGLENIDAVLDSILSDQRIIGMVREVIERQINHDVKVVLINPNHRSGFMSVKPLGLARVGSNLKANGIITEYIDADNKGYSAAVLAKEVACLRNSVKGPMVLGISVLPGGKEYLKEFFANLSGMTNGMKDVYIATGGYLPTMTFREFMDAFPEIDFVIKAEGEAAMVELVRAINGHTSMNEVMNLVYRDNSGKAVESKKYHVLSREELDKLPPPDYSKLIDADDLFWKKTLLDTSRGCPGYCNFCGLHDFMGESKSDDVTRRECKIKDKWWRGRSPKKVVDEMEYLHKKFGITGVDIVDDDFIGYDPGRAKLIAEEILARGLHINFWCLARSDSVVSAGVETMSL